MLSLFYHQVNFQLRRLAETKRADIERFNQLANSVEEFTTSFLDPMRDDEGLRKDFGVHLLDEILDDAIEFEQKKVSLQQKIIYFLILSVSCNNCVISVHFRIAILRNVPLPRYKILDNSLKTFYCL